MLEPESYGEKAFEFQQRVEEWLAPRGSTKRPFQKYVHEYVAQSALFSTYRDPHFTDSTGEVYYLLVSSAPNERPRPNEHNRGRPPSAFLMCLEKISKDSMNFRRVGLTKTGDL